MYFVFRAKFFKSLTNRCPDIIAKSSA